MDKDTDYTQFNAMWTAVHETLGRNPSPMAVRLAFGALARWSFKDVSKALETHLSNPDAGRFPPKPADIVRILVGGGAEDLANLAWSRVERAIRTIGPWETIRCDDPIIMATIRDMGGWIRLCANESERELNFAAREFVRRYAAYVGRGSTPDDAPLALPGILERDNCAMGRPELSPEPIAIEGSSSDALQKLIDARQPYSSRRLKTIET